MIIWFAGSAGLGNTSRVKKLLKLISHRLISFNDILNGANEFDIIVEEIKKDGKPKGSRDHR